MTDNCEIVYMTPSRIITPQTVLPDGAFLLMVCTNKSRLDAILSALSDYADEYNCEHQIADFSVDIVNALARVYAISGDCTDMDFCQLVASCITSGALDSALADWQRLQGLPPTPQTIVPPLANDTNLLTDCSADRRYGLCVGVTDLLFDSVSQALESLELAINPLDLAVAIADNIPLVSLLAIQGEVVSWLVDTAYDNWQVFDTVARRNEIACGLYCMTDDCTLSFDDVATHLYSQSPITWGDSALGDALASIVSLVLPDQIGYSMLAWASATWASGGRFASIIGIGAFMQAIRWYTNDSNPDWVFCPQCPIICELPITEAFTGNSALNCTTVYTAGTDWASTSAVETWQGESAYRHYGNMPSYSAMVTGVRLDIASASTVTTYRMRWQYTHSAPTPAVRVLIRGYRTDGSYYVVYNQVISGLTNQWNETVITFAQSNIVYALFELTNNTTIDARTINHGISITEIS